MHCISTEIPDVLLFEPQVFGDERGFFMETFRESEFNACFKAHGLEAPRLVQENHSRSMKNVLRGLHYQATRPQGKLVRVIAGTVFDVAVDIRPESPTHGRWVGRELSADNRLQLWIPPGFAHGFYVLSDSAEVIYKCSDYYVPQDEHVLPWNDPRFAIAWPLSAAPILSRRDTPAGD
ncbi:dTDP-4-dehydrorhamnose 3,5-epimerase [Shewanella salipaludis]|uniref:dTDP-4-dehydrorhamnose 3,5-epimerase n=1 Tax=Shewanella salipaludis TaxID=2723052 RepID=A0A972G147_9GAMM|nr:dTDP-4-dehydrorhamnose 3,5-epimerase [Shewanella salipaludis]NMH65611.1 dTDP-4-dehydrorhamnose 3,5-epimerase [Shewanella salipaludis]